jgi:hypothetical protein
MRRMSFGSAPHRLQVTSSDAAPDALFKLVVDMRSRSNWAGAL